MIFLHLNTLLQKLYFLNINTLRICLSYISPCSVQLIPVKSGISVAPQQMIKTILHNISQKKKKKDVTHVFMTLKVSIEYGTYLQKRT